MTSKQCRKCGQEKPLADFYVHKQMADGHLNICKDCVKSRVSKHRDDNIEKVREYDRARGRTEERKRALILRQREQKSKDPEAYNTSRRAYQAKMAPGRSAARSRVARALLKGILVRPTECQICHGPGPIDAHHPDYSKPLEVMWLCKPCHGKQHRIEGTEED